MKVDKNRRWSETIHFVRETELLVPQTLCEEGGYLPIEQHQPGNAPEKVVSQTTLTAPRLIAAAFTPANSKAILKDDAPGLIPV